MGRVFIFECVKDAFCEHFESCGAVVFVFVEVYRCECWEKAGGGGIGCGNEGWVRKFVLFVNCWLSWGLCFLCGKEMVARDGGGDKGTEGQMGMGGELDSTSTLNQTMFVLE